MQSSRLARPRRVLGEVCLAFVAVAITVVVFGRGEASRGDEEATAEPTSRETKDLRAGAPTMATAPLSIPGYKSILDTVELPSPAGTDVVVSPPQSSVARAPSTPVFTMLHGMCGTAEDICAATHALTGSRGFLVCPAGNGTCGDVPDWTGDGKAKASFVLGGLGAARSTLGIARDPAHGDVLMGFSRGAFVARDVAYESKDEWVGLVLMGAATIPDADRLRAAGIRRVVLASGDFDGARKTMVAAARKLCQKGLPARFVSLGPIYHALPVDLAARLGPSLDWVRSAERDDACST